MPKIGFRIRPTKSKSASILVNFRPPSSPPLEVRTGLSTNVLQWSQDKQRSKGRDCLLYTSPSPRDAHESRMPSSA